MLYFDVALVLRTIQAQEDMRHKRMLFISHSIPFLRLIFFVVFLILLRHRFLLYVLIPFAFFSFTNFSFFPAFSVL
jgi:hypothetical protein